MKDFCPLMSTADKQVPCTHDCALSIANCRCSLFANYVVTSKLENSIISMICTLNDIKAELEAQRNNLNSIEKAIQQKR